MQYANINTTRSDAKRQALSWLASQLRWEQTLDELRGHEIEQRKAA